MANSLFQAYQWLTEPAFAPYSLIHMKNNYSLIWRLAGSFWVSVINLCLYLTPKLVRLLWAVRSSICLHFPKFCIIRRLKPGYWKFDLNPPESAYLEQWGEELLHEHASYHARDTLLTVMGKYSIGNSNTCVKLIYMYYLIY